jgi:hypothetical protein
LCNRINALIRFFIAQIRIVLCKPQRANKQNKILNVMGHNANISPTTTVILIKPYNNVTRCRILPNKVIDSFNEFNTTV